MEAKKWRLLHFAATAKAHSNNHTSVLTVPSEKVKPLSQDAALCSN
jgi:hypothetical protein